MLGLGCWGLSIGSLGLGSRIKGFIQDLLSKDLDRAQTHGDLQRTSLQCGLTSQVWNSGVS